MHFHGPIIRPQTDADSLFIEVTAGCSHNSCTFCNFYKDTPFRIAPLEQIEQVYWCDDGMLILRHGDIVAQVDDRDISQVLDALHVDGQVASDDDLLAWLELRQGCLTLLHADKHIAVQPLAYASVPLTFGFQPVPQADQD